MLEYKVDWQVVDLLKTLCRLNRCMNYLDLPVTRLSLDIAFTINHSGGEVSFVCCVAHDMLI